MPKSREDEHSIEKKTPVAASIPDEYVPRKVTWQGSLRMVC
jgi:hypothetical protein